MHWEIAASEDPGIVLRSGDAPVDAARDGTVQVTVDNLPAGTDPWYRFTLGPDQIEGRTRTIPANRASMRIGVMSCSKYLRLPSRQVLSSGDCVPPGERIARADAGAGVDVVAQVQHEVATHADGRRER